MTPRQLQPPSDIVPRLLPLVVVVLLWRVDAAAAQCDSGIIVACTLGTFGGCAIIVAVALLLRWTQSRRRRRALFEGDPAIRSYSKIQRGNDNLAFRDDYDSVHARDHVISGNSVVLQDKTNRGQQKVKTSKSSNEAVSGALRAAPDDLGGRSQQDQPHVINVDLVSKDIIGLGFNVQGTYSDGIYISEVHARGPAKETGNVEVGDRVVSLTICTENMAYDDAVALLSYATPYPVTVRLLKSKCDVPIPYQPAVRARYRMGSSSAASAGRQVETLPPSGQQTLRHPAFRGRSQSVDGSIANGCQIVPLKQPVLSAPRLMSTGASMYACTNVAAPPPKPKRSLDLGHAAANGEARVITAAASTAPPPTSQNIPPPAARADEHATLPSAFGSASATATGTFLRDSPVVEEPSVTHVTIEPAFTSIAVRLSPTADNTELTAVTESSLLEDINRFLSHERHAIETEHVAADRGDTADPPVDRSSPISEDNRDADDVPDESDYSENEDSVRPTHIHTVHAYQAGTSLPTSTIRTTGIRDEGEHSEEEILIATNRNLDCSTGRSSPNSLDSLTTGVLYRADEHQVFRSPGLRPRNGSCVPGSSDPPSPTTNDSSSDNDERTSAPSAAKIMGQSPKALLIVDDLGAAERSAATSTVPDSTMAESIGQSLSWSELLERAVKLTAGSESQQSDVPRSGFRMILTSDDCEAQQNGFTVAATQQEAAAKLNSELALVETPQSDVNIWLLPSAESPNRAEANHFKWAFDKNHLAKRRISSDSVTSGDSAAKSSDVSVEASRSSIRGSDDDVTPQPLRKFGNFTNLSNDELDAEGGHLVNHMTDRDSVSSETSTPIHSDYEEESPHQRQPQTFTGVDENLNQAQKIAGLQENNVSPRSHDTVGTRKSIEEARALFFAELLQRGTL